MFPTGLSQLQSKSEWLANVMKIETSEIEMC